MTFGTGLVIAVGIICATLITLVLIGANMNKNIRNEVLKNMKNR